MRALPAIGALLALAGAAGCAAAVPPQELVTARTIYDRASGGPAATVNPTDLHTARLALDAAERSFEQNGDTQETRDLGYVAERRSETAESRARTMGATSQKDRTVAQMHATTAAQAQSSSAGLSRANQALASQGAELQTEVQRRRAAEKRAAEATAALARVGAVTQEARGIVITLSGSVLFTSNRADLLPSAQAKLDEVADALTKQSPESRIVVEGHTDSQGSAALNQDLSQRRAQVVRAYLVSHGIAADRLSSAGFGSTRSIADNKSAEGRANNRRVEIVVQPAP